MEFAVAITVAALLTACLVLWRVGMLLSRRPLDLFQDLVRFDLDKLPLNPRRVNRRYEKLMRKKGGLPGPAGYIQPRKHIVILTPDDDYRYIHHFGIHEFGHQLVHYLNTYARNTASWSVPEADELPTITFSRDSNRKRLRPDVAHPGMAEKKTDFMPPSAEPIRGTARGRVRTKFLEPSGPMATAVYTPDPTTASLRYSGVPVILPATGGEVIVGRGQDCDVVIDHDHFSRRHLKVWPEDGQWHIEVLSEHNETFLNGKKLRGETVLTDGDRITVGRSEPLIFEYS